MRHHAYLLIFAVLASLVVAMPVSAAVCGDSEPDLGEQCDDGNLANGDGCSSTCTIEAGFDCSAAIAGIPGSPPTPPVPSSCLQARCQDGIQSSGEICDDGNLLNGDGCDDTCQIEPGFVCTGATPALDVILDHSVMIIASVCELDNGNEPPQAICQDVRVVVPPDMCSASPSIDAGSNDSEPITLSQAPSGPYPLGETTVVLTVSDGDLESTCEGTVTVVDEASPVITSNAPATITPPDAPISFIATASDNCSVDNVVVQEYDCYKYTKKGKRIDKTGSCQVILDGETVTIIDSGGVGDNITWKIVARDGSGNTITMRSAIEVVNPGKKNR